MTDNTSPRTIRARRLLTLGTAAVGLAAPGVAGAQPAAFAQPAYHAGTSLTAGLHLAAAEGEGETGAKIQVEGEGEGETPTEAEGEGEGSTSAEGEGEGEAGTEAEGEGEGEGDTKAEAEGEGDAHAEAEGEGEASASPKSEAEGESEGGSSDGADDVTFLRDLGFMTGHMRAGMALFQDGDVKAARTHMGHPIKEKFGAVEERLEDIGKADLRADIEALAAATEEGTDPARVRDLFDTVIDKVGSARTAALDEAASGTASARTRLLSLAELTRIAAEEYAVGVKGGRIANLHEYQDSWGFLRTVEAEAAELAQDGNAEVAKAATRIAALVSELDAAYGDLQGRGDMTMDASLLHGAAARMELAALAVR